MNTREHNAIHCPHCGKPFVDMGRYQLHVHACTQERQRELDDEWEERKRRISQIHAAINDCANR